jgi:AcrR family transcriptional regulator
VSDVAAELGVTRQTVYRYFDSTETLLYATALQAAGPFLERMTRHVQQIDDPAEAVVEALAFTIEQLPNELYMGVLVRAGKRDAFAAGISTATARELGRMIVGEVADQWTRAGVAQARIDELVEWQLRILQSMVLDPGDPPRSPAELRAYLRRWLLPAINDVMRQPAS